MAATLVASLVLAGLVWWAGVDRLVSVFRMIGWRGAAWMFCLYAASQALRALRYMTLFRRGECPGFADLCAVVSLHQVGNHLLPVRMGELAFPYLLRRFAGTPVERSLSALLVARLQEIAVLAGLFLVALLLLGRGVVGGGVRGGWLGLALPAMGVVGLAVVFEFVMPGLFRLLARLIPARNPNAPASGGWRDKGARLLEGLSREAARPMSIARRAGVLASTLALWLTLFFMFHELMRLSGYPVSLSQTIVGSSFANLSQILPVNTFGSIGSLEAGWTLGFSLVSVPAKGALATGLALHVLVIGFLIATAAPAWLWLRWRDRKS